ncbi:MAG: ATP-binding protein [Pseudomonadota bacterium]
MVHDSNPEVTLSLTARTSLLPVAVSFVENSATAFGLERADALMLTLAVEEIFAYLCRSGAPERPIEMRCKSGGYFVETEFLFHPREFDMRAFNLTEHPHGDALERVHETGLLIAARMVDRFRFASDEKGLRVNLIKEKAYPGLDSTVAETRPLERFSIRMPEPEELKEFLRLVHSYYRGHVLPVDFNYPGKVVDMAAVQAYRAAIACDEFGRIGGGLLWRFRTLKTVDCCGPYVFAQPQAQVMAQELVDQCIGTAVKTQAVGIINQYPTGHLPAGYFEKLGTLTETQDGRFVEMPVFYRHLHEDPGAAVWAHPSLVSFLELDYGRMAFARDIKLISDQGETRSPFSVISAEFDKVRAVVTLRPIWWGDDAEETLSGDVEVLENGGIHCIFFEMDLGKPWHSRFSPALDKNGFRPRLILPNCGKGDIVVFQHGTESD